MIFIMGGNGFVGSAYARLCESLNLEYKIITRENFDDFIGKSCDLFINANGNSVKFLADREPVKEFDASVRSVVRSLNEIKSDKYVFLSSGDVYWDTKYPAYTDESQILDLQKASRYGLHKSLAETYVRNAHSRSLIMRMGGFVGPNMRKNAIFDMVNNAKVWLGLDSELSFIRTDSAAKLVYELCEKNIFGETINLGPRGTIKLGDVYKRLCCKSEISEDAKTVRFELNIKKLQGFIDGELCSTENEVEAYFNSIGR